MSTYCIYKATNLINNKIYIGCTNNYNKRVWEHKRCRQEDDCYFHRAIQKYGFENFKWEIIDYAKSRKEMLELEKKYIKEYDSYHNGYNSTCGGDGGSMWNVRPIVCLTLDGDFVKRYDSSAQAQREDGFNNTSVLLCCKNKLLTCKKHQFMFEDEYIKYGAKKYKKPNGYQCKSIIQCDLKGNIIQKFDSVTEASEITKIRRANISSCLIKNRKSTNGYIFVYDNEYPIKNIELYHPRKKGIPILQLDIKTNKVVNEFDRISDAGKALGVNYKSIHKVLDKTNRTAYGYKWITKPSEYRGNQLDCERLVGTVERRK